MKTFTKDMKQCAQGDTYYTWVDELPADAVAVAKKKGPLVVAHSESGHDHRFRNGADIQLFTTPDPFTCYLQLAGQDTLEHLRDFDMHEAILFDGPGIVRMKRQRENTPEGYQRMVAD